MRQKNYRMRISLIAVSAALLSALACSEHQLPNGGNDSTLPGGDPASTIVGQATVNVDMSNPNAPVLEIVDATSAQSSVAAPMAGQSSLTGVSLANAVNPSAEWVSIMTGIDIHGPATWDPETLTLSGVVTLTNLSTTDYDEPEMVITNIVVDSTAVPAPVVTFIKTHDGGGGVGATYKYADMPDNTKPLTTARQILAVYDPEAVSFSFDIDVLAVLDSPPAEIVPDIDQDMYNVEVNEHAGDDCDDYNIFIFPGGGTCTGCVDSCDGSCDSIRDCCEDPCPGGKCDLECKDQDCDCYFTSDGNGDLKAKCQEGTVCNVISDGGGKTEISECKDASCNLSCENGGECKLKDCKEASTCDVVCSDSDKKCKLEKCEDASSCSLNCDATDDCEMKECKKASDCQVDCTDLDDCKIDKCNEASCDLDCSALDDCKLKECVKSDCSMDCQFVDECKIEKECKDGSTCDMTCFEVEKCKIRKCEKNSDCTVDCDGAKECKIEECKEARCELNCTNADKCELKKCDKKSECIIRCGEGVDEADCKLECPGSRKVSCGDGVYVCGNTPCP